MHAKVIGRTMNKYITCFLLLRFVKGNTDSVSWDTAFTNCMEEITSSGRKRDIELFKHKLRLIEDGTDKKNPSILMPRFLLKRQHSQDQILTLLTNGTSAWIDGEILTLTNKDGFTLKIQKLALTPESSFPYIDGSGIFNETNITYDEAINKQIEFASVRDVLNGRYTLKEGIFWINDSSNFEFSERKCMGVGNDDDDLKVYEYPCEMKMPKAVCISKSDVSYQTGTLLQVNKHGRNSSDHGMIVLDKKQPVDGIKGFDLLTPRIKEDKSRTEVSQTSQLNDLRMDAMTTPLENKEVEILKRYVLGILIAMSLCLLVIAAVAIIQCIICKRLLLKQNNTAAAKEKQHSVYDEVRKEGMIQLVPTSNKSTLIARDDNNKQDVLPQSSVYETAHDKESDPSIRYGNLIPSEPNESVVPDTPSNTDTGVKEVIENEGIRKSNDYSSFV